MPKGQFPAWYENLRFALSKRRARIVRRDFSSKNYLRRRLCRNPSWADGHLLLAEAQLHSTLGDLLPPTPRDLSTVRLSLKAAALLLSVKFSELPAEGEFRSRREQELQLYSALLEFLEKNYLRALARFQRVLEEKNIVQLSQARHYLALEYAAYTADFLGQDQLARSFVGLIPEKFRTKSLQVTTEALAVRSSGLEEKAERGNCGGQ